MTRRDDLIVGLDIGTTKVSVVVGEPSVEGVDIIGVGTHPSTGLRKGVIINIDSTIQAIERALEDAELMAGREITHVYAGIAGGHIKGLNSHGVVAVKDGEVKSDDIRRVIDGAQAVAIPMDREIIHVIPQEFTVDGQDGIREPLGMSGVRLETNVHIVTAAASCAQNIIKCAKRTGLEVIEIVLDQIASAYTVLSNDEKELGVVLADIGGGTTDLCVFLNGSVVHTAVIPVGGNLLTNDIAVGLRTPTPEAERLKLEHGSALTSVVDKNATIETPTVGGRKARTLSKQILAEIIQARMEETFTLIQRELAKTGFENLVASGVVLTGGGAMLPYTTQLAEQVFDLPVRVGRPEKVGGLLDLVKSPSYATSVGLVLYGKAQQEQVPWLAKNRKVGSRVKAWLGDIF